MPYPGFGHPIGFWTSALVTLAVGGHLHEATVRTFFVHAYLTPIN